MQALKHLGNKNRLGAALGGGAILLGVALVVGYAAMGSHAAASPHPSHKNAFPTPAEPTARQKEAAKFDYPARGATLPVSITVAYDEAKDRTRMVLELKDLRPVAPGYRLSEGALKLTSEFPGRERKPGVGELSVQCLISLATSEAGVLAPGSPPGELVIDGKPSALKPAFPGESGYHSKAKSGTIRESLAFRASTRDLIRLSKASSPSARFGAVTLAFTPAQLADIREFVAHMNPAP